MYIDSFSVDRSSFYPINLIPFKYITVFQRIFEMFSNGVKYRTKLLDDIEIYLRVFKKKRIDGTCLLHVFNARKDI